MILFIKYFIFIFSIVLNQEIPNEFFNYYYYENSFDSGENWHIITTLGSIRFQDIIKNNQDAQISDSLNVNVRLGINKINDNRIEIIPKDTKSNPIDALRDE